MKFLCLPGSMQNAEILRTQLGPIVTELQSDQTADFCFTQGTVECSLPLGFEDYFGPPPHLRFLDYSGTSEFDIIDRLQHFPAEDTAEDTLRNIIPEGKLPVHLDVQATLNDLHRLMDEKGPFDGIIGYSEGAAVAASLLIDEQRIFEATGASPRLKCAIFFSGWPPFALGGDSIHLNDDCGKLIDVATCHVIGSGDPYLDGATALYNVCNSDTAILFDHGKGHTIPRDFRTVKDLGDVVRDMISKIAC